MRCPATLRACWTLISTSLAAALVASVSSAAAPPEQAPPSLYERKDSWTETMLASRASYLRYRDAQKAQAGNPDIKPFVSDPIRGDGPGQAISVSVAGCRWMRLVTILEGGGGNCHIWGEARLIAKDGSVTPLSRLEPLFAHVGWGQLLADRNWQDNPLKIGEKQFKHGIWVHSNSDVCYVLGGKYERLEAWVGMDADRARGVARFKVLFEDPDVLPEVWKRIARDFPAESKRFVEYAGRNYLAWFHDARVSHLDTTAIQHALAQAGPLSEVLRKQLDTLRGEKVPGDDPRWLDLFCRACDAAETGTLLEQLWLADLRRPLVAQYVDLTRAQVPPGDPRWAQIRARIGRIAQAIGTGPAIDPAAMRAGMDALCEAMPGRFHGEAVRKRLDDSQKRWQTIFPAAAQGDEKAVAELPALANQARTLRHAMLASLEGMDRFLAARAHAAMPGEWQMQFDALSHDLRNRGHFERVAAETWRPEALIHEADRDPVDVVLRRTAALLDDLSNTSAAESLAPMRKELEALQAVNPKIDPARAEARFVLFADICRLRREVAFANPLLDFDQIVFIKRHRALFNHMCDQYYGMAATPGGGLYVLSGAFGPDPQLRDVLADAVVARGRLQGQKLSGGPSTPPALRFDGMGNLHGPEHQGGTFLSPDLSCDGRTVLFAYVENRGDTQHRHHTDPTQGHWHEGRCYHVFKVNLDGTSLEQLTDGTWNDFDPCWLPNGRIAFISERRGGYLRCGRVCPNYTLFDMAADGSDITCLSFHETNEWHPSVTHDGMIVWTRWDYVDRHGCTAHMPWFTTLDGRDPRPLHGNYAERRSRPDMEVDVRAVPSSTKYVAVAAPHHGQAYGSLVLIDPKIPDDDAMGPVKRITPEVGFPETQGGHQVYGTPWPLADDYHLCVYDARMRSGGGRQGGAYMAGNYGIYLVDSFGNKELLYRDPEIACLSPIPVKARRMPPAVPEIAQRTPEETNPAARPKLPPDAGRPEGTVAVMNVYDSLKPWPEGTNITHLRVLRLYTMSVPSGPKPHDTGLRVASAGDSVVPVRHVLGTVPVEKDGSAHFTVPADCEIFFQALDERGLAVQSMRSATQVRAGDRLVCAGCHEPKHEVPPSQLDVPLALKRGPSRLVPDVDGSNPFSYPRLVQPVLDKHCVKCHQENADKAPNLAREPLAGKWYASYANLVRKYGFYNYGDSYRTTPGRFGAKASKLFEILEKGHHDVKLSPEEMHRITLWLDCTSMFYGVYEKELGEAQLRGEVVWPTLE